MFPEPSTQIGVVIPVNIAEVAMRSWSLRPDTPGVPEEIWSEDRGIAMPIPICHPDPYIQLPILSWLEAVADTTFVLTPRVILLFQRVILDPALEPMSVLLDPILILFHAL